MRIGFAGACVRTVVNVQAPSAAATPVREDASVDLVAFILHSNDYPAGEAELPADLFKLENIRIVPDPE